MNNVLENRTIESRKTRTSDRAASRGVGRLLNDCVFEALESRTLMSVAAPTSLVATPASPTSIALHWHDNDASAQGYNILRSTDGHTFTAIAKLASPTASSYTDGTAVSGHTYDYEIQAYNGSTVSSTTPMAVGTTPLTGPTSLTEKILGPTSVQLNWTDRDTAATGYKILRSSDGTTFSQIATVAGTSAATYTDNTVASDHRYQYKVESYVGESASPVSNTVAGTTPLVTPSSLTAVAQSRTSVLLHWTDNDSTAVGYNILRSTNGTTWTQIAKLVSGTASTYTDSTLVSGHSYDYEVQAYNGSVTSAVTKMVAVNTPLAAPSALTATAASTTSVTLHWTDNDSSATGYYVLRSLDGVTFTKIGTITSATANSYIDSAAPSGTALSYKVQAFVGTILSPATDAAHVTTATIAPSTLAAAMSGTSVALSWTDKDSSATGYYIYRSTDNVTFTKIATLTSGSAHGYTDATVSTSTTYYYKVQSYNTATHSGNSNMATIATPMGGSGGVAITTRYGNELVITASGLSDTISLLESGSVLTILADGQTFTDAAPAAGVFIYTRGGADTVSVDSSVTTMTTVDAIDGANDTITSGDANASIWDDSTDAFSGSGFLHSVASFAGGVSKALGISLANPSDSGSTVTEKLSLWGTGPTASDVNQGEVGDCYFLSSLAAFAGQSPHRLEQSAVDLGDGTFAVQFYKNGTPTYVRVSNAMPAGPFNGLDYAHPGSNNTMWAMVMEKAFVDFRTGANTYASINSGWMGEVYSDLNVGSTNFFPTSYTESAFYNMLSADMTSGKEVTLGTSSSPPNLVGGHAYTLISVSKDSSGVTHYTVRNPWGESGDALENAQGYATLTFAQMTTNFVDGCAST